MCKPPQCNSLEKQSVFLLLAKSNESVLIHLIMEKYRLCLFCDPTISCYCDEDEKNGKGTSALKCCGPDMCRSAHSPSLRISHMPQM